MDYIKSMCELLGQEYRKAVTVTTPLATTDEATGAAALYESHM
jgi:hypothetical protein